MSTAITRPGMKPLSLDNIGGRQFVEDFTKAVKEVAKHLQEGDFAGKKRVKAAVTVTLEIELDVADGITFLRPVVSHKLPRETRQVAAVRLIGEDVYVDDDMSDLAQMPLHEGPRAVKGGAA